jgi:hypothetical protein
MLVFIFSCRVFWTEKINLSWGWHQLIGRTVSGLVKKIVTSHMIVSQCMSSSGCERNWSTFALVHTKLRNQLSYEKLHKLVYVHYNLKLSIQHYETDMESLEQMKNSKDRNIDPCSIMIDVAMYDEGNPIMEWLCSCRSESLSSLNENDEPESPNRLSGFVLEELGGLNEEEMVILNSRIVLVGKMLGKGRLQKKILEMISYL